MTRFFRRTDDEDSDNQDAPEIVSDDEKPKRRTTAARRTRARRTRSSATKAATSETDSPTTSTRRSSSRSRKTATKESASKASSSTTRSTSTRRASSSRARKAAPKAAPPPPSEDDEVGELLGLLRQQSTLIESQNQLLQSLVEAQDRTTRAVQQSGGGGGGVGGPALEVKPRLAVFVDVPNILYAAERSGVDLDWGKVLDYLSQGRTLVRATAYAPISDDPAARRENERFVVPFMDKGYRIATKSLKRFTGGSVKANFDVELAVDIVTMADRLDVIALVSGDGDFRRVVEMVGNRGVRVEVMAFGNSTSRDLRETADRYIDIAAYVPELSAG